jgi:RHS repeat-associated core domain
LLKYTSIQYNSLNLPRQMDIKSSVAEARNEYTYSASGQKLKAVQKWNSSYSTSPVIGSAVNTAALNMNKTTDYVGNKIYENNALKRILVDGGYIEGGVYYFYLTDHLGNNRVVANASGTAIQKTHYYPFGMAFAENTGKDKQPYKYNGKELDTMHGLNMYDYSARYYDSNLGRFSTVDPHPENYYSLSPYAYVANNPLKFIDPTGMDSIYYQSNFEPTPGRFNISQGPSRYDLVGRVGKGGDDAISITLADVVVTPQGGKYESGGIIRDYHGNVKGEKGLEIVSPEFDLLFLGRGIANAVAKRVVSTGLSNAETRLWYNKQLKSLDTSVSFTEENAMLLHGQRNTLKSQAREMMEDRASAKLLDKTDPLRPFNYYVEKYSAQGYSGESLWQKIIQGASTPNAKVNSKFGIK